MSVDVGSAKGYLDLDISGFLSGLRTAQSEADSTSKNIATKIGGNLSNIGKGLTSAGTTLTKNVTAPLLGIGAAGLKVATDFEKGMSEVKAISGTTGKDFDALKNKAIELGASTAFSAGEVAEAMTEMAKAGWNSQQIIDGMSGVLSAAAASGEGLGAVSTIVADAITGFGLAASDSSRVADLLTQAANSGTIGITDLGESFKYVAPVSGALGLNIEEVTTAISAMSMAGIKGSQAGTALRTILTNLIKPTDAMAVVMEDLNISATNSDGSMKSLNEIVANLRTSFDGLTESEKAENAAILAGKEGMSGMLSILNLTEEEYNAISESMNNASGVAEKTAAVMQDNLQSKIEQLGGSLESLAIKLADYVIPYIQKFVEWLTSLVEKFIALDPETQKTIMKFAGLAAAAGPLLVVLGKVVSGAGNLFTAFGKIPGAAEKVTTSFTKVKDYAGKVSYEFKAARMGFTNLGASSSKLGTALGSLTGPMIAIIAAIALVTAAFVSLWKNNEEFRNNITAIWNQIKETFNNFAQGIVDRLNSLGFNFESITDVLKTVWEGFCNFLAPIFEGVFQQIANVFEFITNQILNVFDFFIAVFKGDWKGAWESIKNIFKTIWDFIKNTFQNVLNTMKNILNTILGWFGTSWSNVWNSIKKTFTNIWSSIKTTASNAWNSIKNVASNVWNAIKNAISGSINSAKTTISNVVNSIKSTISSGFNSAKSTVASVFTSIKNSISNVMNSAKTIVQNAINNIKSKFNFSWSLPKLKMPHPKITGSFSLNPPSVPKFSIEWYKKAMSGGMILNSPTIFGYNASTGQFLGAGEAGSETIVGTESLMKMIRQAVADSLKSIADIVYELTRTSAELGYISYNGFAKTAEVIEKVYKAGNPGGGDTYHFYSPKAIDEIEAARQMKKTKRELAEGF